MTKWIEIKRDDKKTWPRVCDHILFSDGDTVWAGWLETYEPLEDPIYYASTGSRDQKSYPENITHWAIWPSPPN